MADINSENKVILAVTDAYGCYLKGTLVIVDGKLYELAEGYCEECDLGKDCFRKPFNCSEDVVGDDTCLKELKGGI